MSYEKTTWANGDVITAEKLNKLEDGVAGSEELFIVHLSVQGMGQFSLDKTYDEILSAFSNGKTVIMKDAIGANVFTCGTFEDQSGNLILFYRIAPSWDNGVVGASISGFALRSNGSITSQNYTL